MLLSVVSPVYRAEKTIDELVQRLHAALSPLTSDYEIILVDDCGPDNSWAKIRENCSKDARVKGVRLSRNFGQHYAITAGLDISKGDWVVVMDCDLQDRPEEIPHLLAKAKEGFDIVIAERKRKNHAAIRRMYSKQFYRFLSWLTGAKYDSNLASFGIYHHKVIGALNSMRESIRCFPVMVQWVGFSKTSHEVQHDPRADGKTTYTFSKLINLALDIMLAYSDKPLRLTVKLGLTISLMAFLFAAINIYKYMSGQILVPGYASLIISIWFLSGLIIMILGVVGLYLGKTFEGVKGRPLYIVKETLNS